jgi:hypothetical protein
MNRFNLIIAAFLGCVLMGAVTYDSSNPNAQIEAQLERLNANIERLIAIEEAQNAQLNESNEVQVNTLHRIFLSLQPFSHGVDGNLLLEKQ